MGRLRGSPTSLTIDDVSGYAIPIQTGYVEDLPADVRDYVTAHIDDCIYRGHVDRHVFVDGEFVMGVECKSYTENAMLKRVLIDYRLLKSDHPDLVCCLLQRESQLGGRLFSTAWRSALRKSQQPHAHVLLPRSRIERHDVA